MRIVHAVRSDGFAGVERHVARLARAQASAGNDVHVIGGAVAPMARELAGSGATSAPAATTADVVRALRAMPDADVLHVHMTAAEIAATVAALPPGGNRSPVVATRHFARPRGSGRAGMVTAAVARARVLAQVSISTYVAAAVDGPSVVVHPGVDVRPDARRAADRARVVLLAQRLAPEKAADVGLRAFAASGLGAAGWRLHVAGDGTQRPALESLATALGIAAHVDWLGFRSDLPALFDSAGLLVAPCPVEGLGLSVLEAMAHGLPVVASASGGHLELLDGLLDGTSAHLFPVGDAVAAGSALATLAASPASRDRYGAAAQARQRSAFTLDAQVAGTAAVYAQVVATAQAARR